MFGSDFIKSALVAGDGSWGGAGHRDRRAREEQGGGGPFHERYSFRFISRRNSIKYKSNMTYYIHDSNMKPHFIIF